MAFARLNGKGWSLGRREGENAPSNHCSPPEAVLCYMSGILTTVRKNHPPFRGRRQSEQLDKDCPAGPAWQCGRPHAPSWAPLPPASHTQLQLRPAPCFSLQQETLFPSLLHLQSLQPSHMAWGVRVRVQSGQHADFRKGRTASAAWSPGLGARAIASCRGLCVCMGGC